MPDQPRRASSEEDFLTCRPVYAVWEITLACDLKCSHCGSRAGSKRPNELSTEECFDVVRQLAKLGTREVSLIGGEAYLRSDWLDIVAAIRAEGMGCSLTTGGRNLTEERIAAAAKAGLQSVSVSIDGLQATHDRIRGVQGSHEAAMLALERVGEYGMIASSNTQITRLSMSELPAIMESLIAAKVKNWQVQLTVAMGNAVDNADLIIQPYHLLDVMPMLAGLFKSGLERGLTMQAGNNVGYFGPYEALWRGGMRGEDHWRGCNAGQNTIGLEADGKIKGCPSLPTTVYTGGNIRDKSLEDIWTNAPEISFTRDRSVNDLWGYCGTCYYADVCRGGCSWTTHSLFGRPGNNPFCHYRALEFAKNGQRERIAKIAEAPGLPFDVGKFEIVVEPLDAPKQHERLPILREPKIKHVFPRAL